MIPRPRVVNRDELFSLGDQGRGVSVTRDKRGQQRRVSILTQQHVRRRLRCLCVRHDRFLKHDIHDIAITVPFSADSAGDIFFILSRIRIHGGLVQIDGTVHEHDPHIVPEQFKKTDRQNIPSDADGSFRKTRERYAFDVPAAYKSI